MRIVTVELACPFGNSQSNHPAPADLLWEVIFPTVPQ
jgi:hypothetical protein